MHPHNPRSEAREVDGFAFTMMPEGDWRHHFAKRCDVYVLKYPGRSVWVVECNGDDLDAADAAVFAQAIGAAAKLADELNKESK